MVLSLSTPTSLQYFASLVQSDDHFPLLEAAVSVAQDEYPDLDVQQVLGDVDQLLARLKRRLPADAARTESALLIGAAQILWLDVPDHAAVDLSVRLVQAAAGGHDRATISTRKVFP